MKQEMRLEMKMKLKKPKMGFQRAMEIVIDLANQNALDLDDCDLDQVDMAKEQHRAIDMMQFVFDNYDFEQSASEIENCYYNENQDILKFDDKAGDE